VLSSEWWRSRPKSWLAALQKADKATLLVGLFAVAFVGAGLYFRSRAVLFGDKPAFWLDECAWAMNLSTRSLAQIQIRPPGFIVVSRWLVSLFGRTEGVLRAMPYLAGVVGALSMPALGRRLYRSPAAALVLVAIITLNSCAIDFSKEFKPYSVGLTLHIGLMLLTLVYLETGKALHLGGFLAVAAVGSVFSQDLVFAYPGTFLLVAWAAWKSQRRPHLIATFAGAGVVILLLLGQYVFLWRHLSKEHSEHWGSKYNVFYMGQQGESYLRWLLDRYRDLTGFPGIRRDYWAAGTHEEREAWRAVDHSVWLVLHLLGLVVLAARRRAREALLLLLPIVMLIVFNKLGFWPLGAFRTNIFSILYFSAVTAMAFDGFSWQRVRFLMPLPALLLVVLPIVKFEKVWHARKQALAYDSKFPHLLERLLSRHLGDGQKEPLIFDRRTCDPFRFYTQFHPVTSVTIAPRLLQRFDPHCLTDDVMMRLELNSLATTERPVWIVLHNERPLEWLQRHDKLDDLKVVWRFEAGPHTVVGFKKRADAEGE
jgi:hypothetical protein